MKMSKKFKGACAALAVTALTATSIGAANYSRTINATYKNIKVNYNGTTSTLSTEPFLVNGSTYVPLRAVSEVMGADVKWDGVNNIVMINGGNNTSSINNSQLAALQQDVSLKEAQIQSLNTQITQLQAELANYKNSSNTTTSTSGSDITSTELQATEDLLNKDYTNELSDDIDMDYDLTKKSSSLKLILSYTEKSENTAFNKISQKKVANYLEDICAVIAEKHSDIAITGSIEYKDNDVVTFEYSKKGKLTYSYGFDSDDVDKYVEDNYSKFTVYGESVSIKDVSASIGSSTITCTLSIDPTSNSSFLTAWNERESKVYDFLDDMSSDIIQKFNIDEDEYSVIINVENNDNGNTIAKYSSAKSSLVTYVGNLSK